MAWIARDRVLRSIVPLRALPPPRRPEPRQPPERPAGGHQPGLGVGNFLAGLCLGTGGVEVRPKLVGDGLRRLQVALHIIQAVAQRVGLGTLPGQRRVGPVRTGRSASARSRSLVAVASASSARRTAASARAESASMAASNPLTTRLMSGVTVSGGAEGVGGADGRRLSGVGPTVR